MSSSDPASDVLYARLVEQVDAFKARQSDVFGEVPDAIHQMRVAARRIRTLLATYRPFFDSQVTEPIRSELRLVSRELGRARDAEVMRARLSQAVSDEPGELVLGAVARRADVDLGDTYRSAVDRATEVLRSERQARLMRALDDLVASPPWTDAAHEAAEDVLRARVLHDWKRLRRLVAAADTTDRGSRDVRLHDVRKATKRARYAAETLAPIYPDPAGDFIKAMKRLQSMLGEHHDSVTAREELRKLGIQAHLDGDNAFTFGRLHAQESERASDLESAFAKSWKKASKKRLRKWLR